MMIFQVRGQTVGSIHRIRATVTLMSQFIRMKLEVPIENPFIIGFVLAQFTFESGHVFLFGR